MRTATRKTRGPGTSVGSRVGAMAAGGTLSVVSILIFFMAVERYLVRGLAGTVKG